MSEPASAGADADWQRLDPRMLLVHPILAVVRFLPVLFGIFLAGSASGGGPWHFVGVAIPVVLGVLQYLTTSFRITDGRVELKRGLVSRRISSTPVDRVRTVDLTASPIHRVLGLTTLRIGTGSADASDKLDLDALPVARARTLRDELLRAATTAEPTSAGTATNGSLEVVRFDPAWIRFAPFTGGGIVIAVGVIGGGSQVVNALDLWRRLGPDTWSLAVPLGIALVGGLLVLAVVIVGLSVVGYLVSNWGFRLTHQDRSWHVTRGLFTTRETSIDEDRMAGVSVGEPLALRLARGRHLAAIVTGVDRSQTGSSTLVPPSGAGVAPRVAAVVVGSDAPISGELQAHGPAATRRRWTRALVPSLVVLVATCGAVVVGGLPWWAPLPALLLLVGSIGLAVDRASGLGHALIEGYVVARSGSLTRSREVLAVDHVIGWNLRATWFQRRAGLTTLVATTAGGPQSVTFLDVPEADAVTLAAGALPHLVDQFRG